ncbi:hypothetical protein [Shewanella chilikensis]|uniref:hypothetical protein n=1 Tax=Shewanella chilikensis TaxID=558541 RepID=UPI00399A5F0F
MLILKRHKPLIINNDGTIISYFKGSIFLLTSDGSIYKKVCTLPTTYLFGVLSKFRLFERLFRLEPRCAVLIEENLLLLSYRGSCFRVDIDNGKVEVEIKYRDGMANPLFFSVINDIDGMQRSIVFGDYWGNPDRDVVKIYIRFLGRNSKWSVLTEFSAGEVTHIHNIVEDIKRDRLLILTGDSDSESAIWEYSLSDPHPKKIVGGSQLYRACSCYVDGDYLFYGTDSPQEINYLVRLCLKTLEVRKLAILEGPIIYSTKTNRNFIFSSSVEADSSLKGWRYLVSRKHGPGIKSYDSVVYSFDGYNTIELGRYNKDIYPMGLFQFGSVSFCTSDNFEHVYAYGMSVDDVDGKMFKLN